MGQHGLVRGNSDMVVWDVATPAPVALCPHGHVSRGVGGLIRPQLPGRVGSGPGVLCFLGPTHCFLPAPPRSQPRGFKNHEPMLLTCGASIAVPCPYPPPRDSQGNSGLGVSFASWSSHTLPCSTCPQLPAKGIQGLKSVLFNHLVGTLVVLC